MRTKDGITERGGGRVNTQTIRTFLAVAELKSMAAAARKLHFSQQVVSEHVRQLESELGVRLLTRHQGSRTAELTEEGREFLPLARSYAEFQEDFEARVARFARAGKRRVLRLAASSSAHQYIIPHIVNKLMPAFPEMELRLSVAEIREIPAAVENRTFDAAFMFETSRDYPGVEVVPLFSEERCLLCPADTELPEGPIPAGSLPGRFEVVYAGAAGNEAYERWRRQNLPEDGEPALRIDSLMSVPNYLSDRRSWAVVPVSVAIQFISQYPDRLTLRHLEPAPVPRIFNLLISRDYPDETVIRELLRCCGEYVAERPHLRKMSRDAAKNGD